MSLKNIQIVFVICVLLSIVFPIKAEDRISQLPDITVVEQEIVAQIDCSVIECLAFWILPEALVYSTPAQDGYLLVFDSFTDDRHVTTLWTDKPVNAVGGVGPSYFAITTQWDPTDPTPEIWTTVYDHGATTNIPEWIAEGRGCGSKIMLTRDGNMAYFDNQLQEQSSKVQTTLSNQVLFGPNCQTFEIDKIDEREYWISNTRFLLPVYISQILGDVQLERFIIGNDGQPYAIVGLENEPDLNFVTNSVQAIEFLMPNARVWDFTPEATIAGVLNGDTYDVQLYINVEDTKWQPVDLNWRPVDILYAGEDMVRVLSIDPITEVISIYNLYY